MDETMEDWTGEFDIAVKTLLVDAMLSVTSGGQVLTFLSMVDVSHWVAVVLGVAANKSVPWNAKNAINRLVQIIFFMMVGAFIYPFF